MGVKGGVGTSTVAVNLGVQLVQLSKRCVILFDLARPVGHVSPLLDLKPRFSVSDAIESLDRLDTHFLGGLLTGHRSGLEVLVMAIRMYKPEQIVNLLRGIEVAMGNGKKTPQAVREAGINVQTYYRWRKEFGGLKLEQANRLKELEKENSRLKRLVAELSLEKQVFRDVAQGNL
jgi:putative transposase